jgi:hypothetical protein
LKIFNLFLQNTKKLCFFAKVLKFGVWNINFTFGHFLLSIASREVRLTEGVVSYYKAPQRFQLFAMALILALVPPKNKLAARLPKDYVRQKGLQQQLL